jgi:hypothetical protein
MASGMPSSIDWSITAMTDDKTRENRLRRMADRQGLRIEKSRRRDQLAVDYGGYMIVDETDHVVLGASSDYGHKPAYWPQLDDVEAYLTGTKYRGQDGEAKAAKASKKGKKR